MVSHLVDLLLLAHEPRALLVIKLVCLTICQACMLFTLVGCDTHYQTSVSAHHSLERGLLTAIYSIPENNKLGDYTVLEVWCEIDQESQVEHLVVRLKGPHHGEEPRVEIVEPEGMIYRSIWSQRDGPPYELSLIHI